MLRSMRILMFSSLALLPAIALAETSKDTGNEAAARELAEATATCDKGAAIPLDREAQAPPVQFVELLPYDFDMTKLEALQRACQLAWAGAPKNTRLQLEWLRVSVALNKPGQEWLLIPQIKTLADAGSAEAQYLMFKMFAWHDAPENMSLFPIQPAEALHYLQMSAEQGHMSALYELMMQYSSGSLVQRDAREAVRIGRRFESAPPQGIAETAFEADMRTQVGISIAIMTLEEDGFTIPEQRIAFGVVREDSQAGTNDRDSARIFLQALRSGRGTEKDPAKVRQLLERRIDKDKWAIPMLADMLAKGEGGPVDAKRALAMVRDPAMHVVSGAAAVDADILLDGKVVGKRPQEAIQALYRSPDLRDKIRLAGLLVEYRSGVAASADVVDPLGKAAERGNREAALALARLKLSENSQFSDAPGARALLKPLVDADNREALWLYAASQYANLGGSSSQPYRQPDGLSDEQLKSLIAEGMEKKEPQAFLLKARLLRKGVVYRQDDEAATATLINAANLGNVDAMVLLGNAYDDGLGIPKNPRERLHAWREAAKHGSLVARQNLANAFTFDTFDKLMTLEEGVTAPLVLYINGFERSSPAFSIDDTMVEVRLGTIFNFGSRAMDAGTPAVAEAAMNAFREAPAGLDEKTLTTIAKAFPDEIRIAIERKLKSEGFYSGQPNGYFGPDVRQALAAWVEAKGARMETAPDEAKQDSETTSKADELVAPEIVARVRDRAFKDGMAAKTDRQKLTAISALNALAQYGDSAARWALVRNYNQARVVRKIVSPAEVTRYALDIMVSKPEGTEKADIEIIFDITQIDQDRQIRTFGSAVLAAIRDDARLQDPLTLGSIMKQFIFAPGACDALLDTGRKARIQDLGSDGCDDDTMAALIAFAKARGPAGVDAAARKSAAVEIKAMDEEAGK